MTARFLPQDRAERIGLIVSGAAHLALILWALVGGIFFPPTEKPATISTTVSLMSSEEFAALEALAPKSATESPAAPSVPKPAPKPPKAPKPEAKPKPPAPKPPAPEPVPDAAPDVTELSPVETDATDAPPSEVPVPAPDSLSQIPDVPTEAPRPKAAPTVAPTPADDPSPTADTAPDVQEQTIDTPSDQPKPDKPKPETAPEQTGEVLLTEDNKDEKPQTAAPASSPRPHRKPEKPEPPAPAPAEATVADTAEPAVDAAPADATSEDALAAALDEAMAGEASDQPQAGTGAADQGPPLTDGDKDAFRIAVKECWNVGALSTDALHTIVTIGMTMTPDGKPGDLRLIGTEGGSDASAQQAFEAGRRAILRCAKGGYPLPSEKYEQWKEIEITFDPSKMALR